MEVGSAYLDDWKDHNDIYNVYIKINAIVIIIYLFHDHITNTFYKSGNVVVILKI